MFKGNKMESVGRKYRPLAALWKSVSTQRVLTLTARVWVMSTALSGRGSFCSEPTHTLNGAVSERVRVREREREQG